MQLGSRWAKATVAVLTLFATLLQIGSWVWPTSREWVDHHGLWLLASNIVLLIALAMVLWRPSARSAPEAHVPHEHPRLSESDQRLLHYLLTVLHPDAVLNDQVTREQALELYAKVAQSYNPNMTFNDEKLDDYKRDAIGALVKWKVLYARTARDPQGLKFLATQKSSKLHSAELACKDSYRKLWQRAKMLGF